MQTHAQLLLFVQIVVVLTPVLADSGILSRVEVKQASFAKVMTDHLFSISLV